VPIATFGSLAHEVMDAGVASVVAMRYNLWVITPPVSSMSFIATWWRDWAKAKRLQRRAVEWNGERAATPLNRPAETLDGSERHRLRTPGAALHDLGEIQRGQENAVCVPTYEESSELMERIADTASTLSRPSGIWFFMARKRLNCCRNRRFFDVSSAEGRFRLLDN